MSTLLIRNRAKEQPWTCEPAKDAVRPVRDRQEHRDLLHAKTLEEVTEFATAPNLVEMIKEAADVLETLISTIYVSSMNEGQSQERIAHLILTHMHAKREQLGDFTDGLVLEIKRAKD